MHGSPVACSSKRLIQCELEVQEAFLYERLLEQEPKLVAYNSELRSIKQAFESIALYLHDAQRKRETDDEVKNWVANLTQIILELEKSFDEDRQASIQLKKTTFFDEISSYLLGHCRRQQNVFDNLPSIAARLDDIQATMPRTKIQCRQKYEYEMPASGLFAHHDIRAQRTYADDLQGLLLQRQAQRLDIFVHGNIGTGKSTVVSMACNRVKKHFRIFIWVDASGLDDVMDILVAIWIAICKDYPIGQSNGEVLPKCILDFLNGSNYLLVLDGISNISTGSWVLGHLPPSCGKIVIVTRVNPQSQISVSNSINICEFSTEDVKEFFWKKLSVVLESNTKRTMAEKITGKCKGSVLGAAVTGSILSTKREDHQWEEVLDRLDSLPDAIEDKVMTFVSIGYADLPAHLKACFLYTSILFSNGNKISKKRLTRMWMAEGLVVQRQTASQGTSRRATIEEYAEKQLDELIHRNMLETAQLNDAGEVIACKVLGPMRSFAISVASAQNLSTLRQTNKEFEGCASCFIGLPQDLLIDKRIAYNVSTIINCTNRTKSGLKFLLWELTKCPGLSNSKFKLLRVLDLQGVGLIKLHDSDLENILLLRYLGLRNTGVKRLPESLWRLQNLQTLDIKNSQITILPKNYRPLPKLRHLILTKSSHDKSIHIPSEIISDSLELQTLVGFSCTDGILQELRQQTQLKKLSVGNVMEVHSGILCTSINEMELLCSLTVKCHHREQLDIQTLRPNQSLNKLKLGGHIPQCLQWVSNLHSLTSLSMWDNNLAQDPLSALRHLPNLIRLTLINAFTGESMQCIERGFSKLKYLTIRRFKSLENWGNVEHGAMPVLQELQIGYCPCLKKLPQGLETLPCSPIRLSLTEMSDDFIELQRRKNYIVEEIRHVSI